EHGFCLSKIPAVACDARAISHFCRRRNRVRPRFVGRPVIDEYYFSIQRMSRESRFERFEQRSDVLRFIESGNDYREIGLHASAVSARGRRTTVSRYQTPYATSITNSMRLIV